MCSIPFSSFSWGNSILFCGGAPYFSEGVPHTSSWESSLLFRWGASYTFSRRCSTLFRGGAPHLFVEELHTFSLGSSIYFFAHLILVLPVNLFLRKCKLVFTTFSKNGTLLIGDALLRATPSLYPSFLNSALHHTAQCQRKFERS